MSSPLLYDYFGCAGRDGGANGKTGIRPKWYKKDDADNPYLRFFEGETVQWAKSIGAAAGEVGICVRHPFGIGEQRVFKPLAGGEKLTTQTYEAPLLNLRDPEHQWRLWAFIDACNAVSDYCPIMLYTGFAGAGQELDIARRLQEFVALEAGISLQVFDATYSNDINDNKTCLEEAMMFEMDTGVPYGVEANPRKDSPHADDLIASGRAIVADWDNWTYHKRVQPEEVLLTSGSCAWFDGAALRDGDLLIAEAMSCVNRGLHPILIGHNLNDEADGYRLLMAARSKFAGSSVPT